MSQVAPLTPEDTMPPDGFDGDAVRVVVKGSEVIFWTRLGERSFIRQSVHRTQALSLANFLVRALSIIPGTNE